MRNHSAVILLLGALIVTIPVAAATVSMPATGQGTWITIKGDITRKDANAVEILMRAAVEEGLVVRGVQLNSTGGNLLGGIALARLIRAHHAMTVVPYGATCASACFLALAAGSTKQVDYNGLVGIHGVTDHAGSITEETIAATRAMARFCQELGVPLNIVEKLIATPPNEISWLSPDDLQLMGVQMIGRPQATMGRSSHEPAQSHPASLNPPESH